MRGRKPKTEAQRQLEEGGEITRIPTDPGFYCPKHLDAEARAEWGRVAPALKKLGLLSRVDGPALAAYCQCVSDLIKITRTLRTEGLTYTAENGLIKAHPGLRIQDQLLKHIKAYAVEFGFTPSSRGRIDLPPAPSEEKDEMEQFLQ